MAWEYIGDILRLTVLGGLGAAGILTVLLWKKNLATKVTFLRLVVQAVAFAALFYVFSLKLPLLYFFIFIFAITLFLGRFYCGWLCPFGFVMDIEVMLRKALGIRYRILPERLNGILHKLRYVIVAVFLALPIVLWFLQPPQNLNFADGNGKTPDRTLPTLHRPHRPPDSRGCSMDQQRRKRRPRQLHLSIRPRHHLLGRPKHRRSNCPSLHRLNVSSLVCF